MTPFVSPTRPHTNRRDRNLARALATLTLFVVFASSASAQGPAAGVPGSEGAPPMRLITAAEIPPYLDTLRELAKLGVEFDGAGGDAASYEDAVQFSTRAQESLTSRGFTPESFTSIHWNVMMAYTALEMKDQEPKLAEARKEQQAALEQMRAQMSPEQFAQMQQMMSGLDTMVDAYADVPPANIELVKRHVAELEAIVKAPR